MEMHMSLTTVRATPAGRGAWTRKLAPHTQVSGVTLRDTALTTG